jgi:HAD superfamily hydrolase (TIGR01493 family)
MTIRALVFDAYGTLYDVQSVLAKAEALCPGKGEVITQLWRLKQLEYTWLRSLLQQYEDFWEVTRASLDFALRAAGVEPNEAVRIPLMQNYFHLDPYPEARNALAALEGRKLAILSNGSPRMLQKLVRNSGWISGSRPRSASTASEHTSRAGPVTPSSSRCSAFRRRTCSSSRRTASMSSAPRPSASMSPGSAAVAAETQLRCSACCAVARKNSATLQTMSFRH